MPRLSVLAFAFALVLPAAASAQSSRFGTSGPLGAGLSGTRSLGGPTNPGSGTFGGSGFSALDASGLNTVGMGGGSSFSGTGQSSSSGGSAATQASGLSQGQVVGTNPFVGRNQNAGMIGNRFTGQMGATGFQQFQGLQGFGNQFGNSNFNNRSGGNSSGDRLGVRPMMRIAFDAPATTPSVATERVSAQLVRVVERRPELSNVTVLSDDEGRVVLRGTVANQDARELAAALVRLEPGVRGVVNELAVASGTSR